MEKIFDTFTFKAIMISFQTLHIPEDGTFWPELSKGEKKEYIYKYIIYRYKGNFKQKAKYFVRRCTTNFLSVSIENVVCIWHKVVQVNQTEISFFVMCQESENSNLLIMKRKFLSKGSAFFGFIINSVEPIPG